MTVHTGSEADRSRRRLAGAAGRHFGGPAAIERLARESGGASRQTWSFDALVDGERHGLILRRDPPTDGQAGDRRERSRALDRATEFRVLAAAHKARRARAARCCSSSPPRTGWARPSSCAGSAARRSPASSCAIRLTPKARDDDRGPARRDPGAHPCRRARRPAAAGPSRGRRPHRRPAPPARHAGPAATGVRAGAVLARPAQAARRSPGRCWCMATTAPATISPTKWA